MKILLTALLSTGLILSLTGRVAAEPSIERGQYLVGIIGCADCHSPRTSEGAPDMSRALSGGLGFEIPGMGIFWAPNITPAETGTGAWSEDELVTALRTGMRPDGRMLAPVMPWNFYAAMTDDDAVSIARYVKSLPAIENAMPAPVSPGQVAPAPYLTMVFPTAPKS